MSADRKTGEQSNGWMALGVAGAFVLGMGFAVNYAQNYYQNEAAQAEQDIENAMIAQFPGARSIEADVGTWEAFWDSESPDLLSATVRIVPTEGSCPVEFSTGLPNSTEPQIRLYYPEIEGDTSEGWKAITDLHIEERFVLPNGDILKEYPDNRPELAGEPERIIVEVASLITVEDLAQVAEANC